MLLTVLFAIVSLVAFGQSTYQEWAAQAEANIRLKPKYGNVEKTKEQQESDRGFVEQTMKSGRYNGDKTLASDQMIELGFQYLYKGDLKTAMYRFNQAFLLDSENTDIYWGFGAIYMALSNLEKAKEQYEEGLKLEPKNPHLLTDYGTYYLVKYYEVEKSAKVTAKAHLGKAIGKLTTSYDIDPKDQNTLYKLSVCYLLNNDCPNAKKFYKLCKAEGGEPITEAYTKELNSACSQR